MKNFIKKTLNSNQPLGKYAIISISLFFVIIEKTGYIDYIKMLLDADICSIYFGSIRVSIYTASRGAFILLFIVYIAGVISSYIASKIKSIKILEPANRALITKVAQISTYFIFGMIALHFIGIDITALAVFSGAIGIGIGIGLQKITSNVVSGIILLFERSIREGDIIETSTGIIGSVTLIASRYVLIESFDGKEVIMPNEDFITNPVINWTLSHKKIRIETIIPLDYSTDVEKAMKIVLDEARNISSILKDPAPICAVKNFDNGLVNLRFCFWIEDVTKGLSNIKSEVLFSIWTEFRKNQIKLVHLDYTIAKVL